MSKVFVKPRCDDPCPNYKWCSGADGECHVSGPPFKVVKADDFCPKHPDWHDYLVEIGAAPPEDQHGNFAWDGPRD